MNYYYITGTGKGLGKALAELLLKSENNKVVGLSRTNSIDCPSFDFRPIDLSNSTILNRVNFIPPKDAKKVVLINNAGSLGEIGHIGAIDNNSITSAYILNVLAPAILSNTFIKAFESVNIEKQIVNISSGAASAAIDGWATYCSSKAALDMFSKTVFEEQKLLENPVKIISIAPGILDTKMQEKIRESNENEFSNIQRFKDYKINGDLKPPENIAEIILDIISDSKSFEEVVTTVRNHPDY